MRLLIAGWQGQIARAFVEAAPARSDVKACAVGRPALDICEIRTIERALSDNRPDIVINTAGYTAVDAAEADPERALALNAQEARLLAEAAARRGVPIIHLSTAYVFDGEKQTPYVEYDPTAPRTTYGRTKLAGETAVCDANPRHIILRTSWIVSEGGRNFLTNTIERARHGEALRVVDDQRGNPSVARELVDAILDIAAQTIREKDRDRLWGTYHIANGGVASWYDVARHIIATDHATASVQIAPISSSEYPTPAPRPTNMGLDTGKLANVFGVSLRGWREAVADCVERVSIGS